VGLIHKRGIKCLGRKLSYIRTFRRLSYWHSYFLYGLYVYTYLYILSFIEMIIDMNCHYKIIYHSHRTSEGLKIRYVDVRESYAVTLNGLIPEMNYTVLIKPYYKFKNKSSTIISGDAVEFKFSTPLCLETNNFNLNQCRKYRHLISTYIYA